MGLAMRRVQITRVLCPIDFSVPSIYAYDHAISVARHYSATLVAAHIVETWKYPCVEFATSATQYEEFFRELEDSEKTRLEEFVRNRTPVDVVPQCVIQEGTAPAAILAVAERLCTDLIVIGTHGLHGLDRWVMGSVTEKVLRKARCPVLAVHGPSAHDAGSSGAHYPIELREVLLCTDFSVYAQKACEYALSIAEEYDANLTLLHVLEEKFQSSRCGSAERSQELLRKLIPEELRNAGRISCSVRAGTPYQVIHELGREMRPDLIVMGVHGRNRFHDAVFGSTTYRVLQLADCPVLAVHSVPETADARSLGLNSAAQVPPSSDLHGVPAGSR